MAKIGDNYPMKHLMKGRTLAPACGFCVPPHRHQWLKLTALGGSGTRPAEMVLTFRPDTSKMAEVIH